MIQGGFITVWGKGNEAPFYSTSYGKDVPDLISLNKDIKTGNIYVDFSQDDVKPESSVDLQCFVLFKPISWLAEQERLLPENLHGEKLKEKLKESNNHINIINSFIHAPQKSITPDFSSDKLSFIYYSYGSLL